MAVTGTATSRSPLRAPRPPPPPSRGYNSRPRGLLAAQCRPWPWPRPSLSSASAVAADACPRSEKMAQLERGSLVVGGRELLERAPPSVALRPAFPAPGAAFLGATAPAPSSRHVFSLGTLARGWKWLSLFRFKIWWMIPTVGEDAAGVPAETQMLLLESRNVAGDALYALMLPVLDGGFRASLQGSPENELQFCFESGDPEVRTLEAVDAVFINSGDNPFKLMKESIKMLSKIKGTFSHIEDKEIPANLDWFGWCTWDAFYKAVNPVGIEEGLKRRGTIKVSNYR